MDRKCSNSLKALLSIMKDLIRCVRVKIREILKNAALVRFRSRAEVEPPLPETPPTPAPALPRPEELEPGSQRQYSLDDFELIRVIGRGSYAKVRLNQICLLARNFPFLNMSF